MLDATFSWQMGADRPALRLLAPPCFPHARGASWLIVQSFSVQEAGLAPMPQPPPLPAETQDAPPQPPRPLAPGAGVRRPPQAGAPRVLPATAASGKPLPSPDAGHRDWTRHGRLLGGSIPWPRLRGDEGTLPWAAPAEQDPWGSPGPGSHRAAGAGQREPKATAKAEGDEGARSLH